MSEDLSDMMSKFSSMMNSGNIPDNLKDSLGSLMNSATMSKKEETTSESKENVSQEKQEGTSSIDPSMIENIMKMFNSSNTTSSDSSDSSSSSTSTIDIEMLMKMKSIMDKMNSNKDDPRSNLLLSLKPYLKESRKDKVEQYIKLFNMSKVMDVLKPNSGGDKK